MINGVYKHLANGVAWFTAFWLAFGMPLSPLQFIEPAKAANGNMILFWDSADPVPTGDGWTDISDGDPGDFMDLYIRAGSTYQDIGGATTHEHTVNYVSETAGSTLSFDNMMGGGGASTGAHSHGSLSGASVGSANNTPSYRSLRVMEYTAGGVPTTIPGGAIAIFESTSDYGAGWTTQTAQNTYFLYGDDGVATGGSATHTHSWSTGLGLEGSFDNIDPFGAVNYGAASHTHAAGSASTTGTDSNNPPYVEVVFAKADSDTTTYPSGMIAGFTDSQAIPSTWDFTISESGGTYYQKFLVGDSSSPGGTGGDTTSDHSNDSHTTGTPSATGKDGAQLLPSSTTASDTHTHSVTSSFSQATNTPAYMEMLFAEYLPPDLTWATASADFDIYQSSSSTWNAGTLICSATLTDNNASTVECTSGTISASTAYRIDVILKNAGNGAAHMDTGSDTVVFANVIGGWAGTSPTIGACSFKDLDTDNTGSPSCVTASGVSDVTITNGGASSDVVIAASTGTEGFSLLITTDTDPATSSTSYMDTTIDAISEDSSKITISTPSALGITAPANVQLGDTNPGTTLDMTFAGGELVTVTDGGSGWTLSVISTALTDTGTVPASDIYLRKDGIYTDGGGTYTIWSGVVTFLSEVDETVALDTAKTVGIRTIGGSGGDETNVRPSIQIVVPPGTPAGTNYNGDLTFTIA